MIYENNPEVLVSDERHVVRPCVRSGVLRGWRRGSWNAASHLPQTGSTSAPAGRDIETSTANHALTPKHREVTAAICIGSAGLPEPVQLQSSSLSGCACRALGAQWFDLDRTFSALQLQNRVWKTAVATFSGLIICLPGRSDGIWQTATGYGWGI